MTDSYLVLIPGDEAAWDAATDEQHQAVFAQHRLFQEALDARGMRVVASHELAPAKVGCVVRCIEGAVVVTQGPYAESVEQLSGYYVVETDDHDALVEAAGILARAELRIEIRPTAGAAS